MNRFSNPPVWKTKDGRFLLPSQMTDVHLANTLAMMKRKRKALEAAYCEAHSYYDDAEECAFCDGLDDAKQLVIAWIQILEDEAKARPDGVASALAAKFAKDAD